jgi:hypothetical protein
VIRIASSAHHAIARAPESLVGRKTKETDKSTQTKPLTKSSVLWGEGVDVHAPRKKHAMPRSAQQGEARAHGKGRSLALNLNCLVQAAISKLRM